MVLEVKKMQVTMGFFSMLTLCREQECWLVSCSLARFPSPLCLSVFLSLYLIEQHPPLWARVNSWCHTELMGHFLWIVLNSVWHMLDFDRKSINVLFLSDMCGLKTSYICVYTWVLLCLWYFGVCILQCLHTGPSPVSSSGVCQEPHAQAQHLNCNVLSWWRGPSLTFSL